jgi:hypothetical protein
LFPSLFFSALVSISISGFAEPFYEGQSMLPADFYSKTLAWKTGRVMITDTPAANSIIRIDFSIRISVEDVPGPRLYRAPVP